MRLYEQAARTERAPFVATADKGFPFQ
jgi:hypothetical protein